MAPHRILGRDAELAAISRYLAGGQPAPRALLIEGPAGIGKTTLWLDAIAKAGHGSRVLTSRASEAETKASFTTLTDLLEPAVDEVGQELPFPQRRALEAALLREESFDGDRLDARAVSQGTLGALRTLAARSPLTLAIDDVQWIDAPSARALSFALRRLNDQPVTVVSTRRTAPGSREPLDLARTIFELHRMAVGPIAAEVLGSLLRGFDLTFPRPLVLRIHEASGGNPFFALELGRALDRLATPPEAGDPLPVPDDLHVLLRDRLRPLSADARRALLLVASSAARTVNAVEVAGASAAALQEAERAEIVTIRGDTIDFTHPLLASAMNADATPSQRRAAHRELATVATDLERRARHLALSSADPDPEIAAVLDEAALNARARGAPQAAAELCELAERATPESDIAARHGRAKARAGFLFDAGDPPHARRILESLIEELPSGPPRSDALFQLSGFKWKDLRNVSSLLQQALTEAEDDVRLRSEILSDLAWIELDMCELAPASRSARTSIELAESVGNTYGLRRSLSVLALIEFLTGMPARKLIERAIELQGPIASADLSSAGTCRGRLLTWAGELQAARETFASELSRYRSNGADTPCYEILAHLAEVEYRAGEFDKAIQHLTEAEDIAEDAGLDVMGEILPVRAAVECATGELVSARDDATQGLAICERTDDRWNEIRCRSVLGSLELMRSSPKGAYSVLEPVLALTEGMGVQEPGVFPLVPDAVEALIGLGRVDRAKELTERLEEQGRERGRSLALGTAARCHGMITAALGDLPGAASLLERSIDELRRVPQPVELAKSLLLAGEIGRRMKKKKSARELLDRALAIFEDIGAGPWAEKARMQRARIGGRPGSSADLTSSEKEIAALVAEGRTNREVAGALFVSVNTVEANLKRIYRKLGVRSRTELARRIGERPTS